MHKFIFRICRDTTESVEVTVEANSIDEAQNKGLAMANSHEVHGWESDGPVEKSAYLPDEEEYEEEDEEGMLVLGHTCGICNKKAACFDSCEVDEGQGFVTEKIMCRGCAMEHDDHESDIDDEE